MKTFEYKGQTVTAAREWVYAQGRRDGQVQQWVARDAEGNAIRNTDMAYEPAVGAD